MRRTLRIFGASALMLALAGSAAAGPGHGFHAGPPPAAHADDLADRLGLDDETREVIRGILADSHAAGSELRREVEEARRALRAQLEADPVDRDAVMAGVERVGELETAAQKHRIETMLAIREQLTPEQRAELVELHASMRGRHFAPILERCTEEVAARCEGDGPRALHCLLRQRDELSGDCAEALESLPHHFGHGGPGHGRPGMGGPPPWHDGAEPLE